MSTQTHEGTTQTSAEPGPVFHTPGDLGRADEVATDALEAVKREEHRLAAARARGGVSDSEQMRRLEEARRDLDAAEAFAAAIEGGRI